MIEGASYRTPIPSIFPEESAIPKIMGIPIVNTPRMANGIMAVANKSMAERNVLSLGKSHPMEKI